MAAIFKFWDRLWCIYFDRVMLDTSNFENSCNVASTSQRMKFDLCWLTLYWNSFFFFCYLSRPSSSSSLKITDRSFRYASPCLWDKLPGSFRQPNPDHFFSLFLTESTHLSYHHHCHCPSLLLFSTLNSKTTFSLNPSRHRPHPFHRTALTDTGLLSGFLFSFFSINLLVWFVQ